MTAYRIWVLAALVVTGLSARDYDLQQLLDLAERNNQQIRLAQADLKTASAEKLAALARALPTANVTGGYNRNFQEDVFFFEVTNPQTGQLETQSFKASFTNQFQLNAVLSQTLFSFEVGYAIQAARYLNKLTGFTYEAVNQTVLTSVKTAFYQAILQQEVLRVAREAERSARDNYDNTRIKFDNGAVSEFELLQAESRWLNTQPVTIQEEARYQAALNQLKSLVGLSADEEMTLDGSLERFPELPDRMAGSAARDNRPDFNALIWEEKLREKNVGSQRSGFFPTLDASLRYSYSAASDEMKLERENDNIILGLSLNIPIFTGGTNIANVRRANAELDKVRARIDQAELDISVELSNLHLQMTEARKRIDATQKAVMTARRAFEIAETRAMNGLSTQLELKDSRLALDQAQLSYYSAVFDYLASFFAWQLATGQVTETF